MEEKTEYGLWKKDDEGFHRYLKLKKENKQDVSLPHKTELTYDYPNIYYQQTLLGRVDKQYAYEFESISNKVNQVSIDLEVLNSKKEVVAYIIKFTIQQESVLKSIFHPEGKKVVKEYGKPAKFSWFRFVYYGATIVLSLIALIYSIVTNAGAMITIFFALVMISSLYLLYDYVSELKRRNELERFKK